MRPMALNSPTEASLPDARIPLTLLNWAALDVANSWGSLRVPQ